MSEVNKNSVIDYKRVFHSSPTLYMLLLPNAPVFTIVDASDTYLRATLRTREEVMGRGLFEIFPDNPDDPNATGTNNLRSSIERVIKNKQVDAMPLQKYDIPVPAEMGGGFEERFWDPKNTPVFDADGQVIYILHDAVDVTQSVKLDQKRVQEAKLAAVEIEKKSQFIEENQNRINNILNSLLVYTTLDFSDRIKITEKGDELDAIVIGLNSLIDELEFRMDQLNSLNHELEYANQELDSFSYSVSHDLRAPLRAISGYSQVLVEDYSEQLDEYGKNTIEVIVRNATRMSALIDDLLTFSKVGKQNIAKVSLSMNDIFSNVINDLLDDEKRKRCEFNIGELGTVEADGSMIKQVVTNLVSNAIKYSGKKEKSIIEIGSYLKDDMAVFYVKDNGAGFDMKYYDKLFGVFQRLHSGAEFEGTGVGLALVQRIIKKHKGDLWAEARPEEGATFSFSLPLRNTVKESTTE